MRREAETLKTTERALVLELEGEPPRCVVCGSTDGVRRFALVVDGEPLLVQPQLCQLHGDMYLRGCARAFAEMLK